jgi:putative ABC transport system ATP-binding protein
MIRIKNLNKKFNAGSLDEVIALKDISLEVARHEFLTVIGTNGSGKSTLLNVIAGNILADSGAIGIDGIDVTRHKDYQRAKYVARVFQNPFTGTAPDMTLAENLLMAWLRGKRRYPKISLSRMGHEFFQKQLAGLEMQMEDRLSNTIGTLSGGQRQAITLLMAVMQKPKVLLLDEHTAALDPKTANQVLQLTQKFVTELRLTTVMVTHSMKQALELGTRTIMMHHGQIIEDIPASEKKNLTVEDLLSKFDDIRKREKLTPELIGQLKSQYI